MLIFIVLIRHSYSSNNKHALRTHYVGDTQLGVRNTQTLPVLKGITLFPFLFTSLPSIEYLLGARPCPWEWCLVVSETTQTLPSWSIKSILSITQVINRETDKEAQNYKPRKGL